MKPYAGIGEAVNKAFDRLSKLLQDGTIFTGGEFNKETRFIAPTILTEVKLSDDIIKDEIFGPILPVFSFANISEPFEYIASREKPLDFYYFGKNKKQKKSWDKLLLEAPASTIQ